MDGGSAQSKSDQLKAKIPLFRIWRQLIAANALTPRRSGTSCELSKRSVAKNASRVHDIVPVDCDPKMTVQKLCLCPLSMYLVEEMGKAAPLRVLRFHVHDTCDPKRGCKFYY